jgi:hypothetical protein
MALVSPGVEITVIDESNYVPNASGTVPFIVIATAENKTNGAGTGIAPGTTSANAGNTYLSWFTKRIECSIWYSKLLSEHSW